MMLLYHMLTTVLVLLALPFLPLVWLFSKKRRANLVRRLGIFTGIPGSGGGGPCIWVHALSVGEVKSAIPFVCGLRQRMPRARIIFTATTRTGYATASSLMSKGKNAFPVDLIAYFPFDFWLAVMRVCRKIRPDVVCLVETDLWPGFLSIMKWKKIPVVLVNARLSDRSLKGYLRMGRFAFLFFSSLSCVMAQSLRDARAFQQLGIPEGRCPVTGNIKFDQPPLTLDSEDMRVLRQRFGIRPEQAVFIAGSTHEGEEKMIAKAFSRVKKEFPKLKLIIAPRDPERGCQVERLPEIIPYHPACLSAPEPQKCRADIVVIDTLGELARAYGICDIAFVGGSLVARGGHNPLEPAMFGKPVLFGPHMTDFREVVSLLGDAGGAGQVEDENALTMELRALLTDVDLREAMGAASRAVFASNSGAVDRTLDIMEEAFFD
ncbi:MAG: 3-deoxy-D-manno-octulosonic acid transferase [Desulfobacter sp.]